MIHTSIYQNIEVRI